ALAVIGLDLREGRVVEDLVEPVAEVVSVRSSVTAKEIPARVDVAEPTEIDELGELRVLEQIAHLRGVVAGGEIRGDDRARARSGDAHPFLDGLLLVLGESNQRACEAESLDSATAKDAVCLFDPVHGDPLPSRHRCSRRSHLSTLACCPPAAQALE